MDQIEILLELGVGNVSSIFWWRDIKYGYNFGDEIVPYLFKKMFDICLQNPCKITDQNIIVSIGSLLWMSNSNIEFWGTGILSLKDKIAEPKRIHGVRGLFSQKKLFDSNIDCPSVYGDPSILLKNLYHPNHIEKKYKLGIIPHIIDYKHINEKYKDQNQVLVINLKTKDIENVINNILSCEKTISSSLHGLIISVVYSIPTRWVKFSNRLYGDGIKFFDFFSTIDSDVYTKFDFDKMMTYDSIYNFITINHKFNFYDIFALPVEYPNIQYNQIKTLRQNCPLNKIYNAY